MVASAKSAELSNENIECGTEPAVTDLARYTMGDIDLDVASSAYWNHYLVKAPRYFTKEDNALEQVWNARRVFCNPPGTTDDDRIQGSVPRLFWERALDFYERGIIECMFWVGFNMSQLQVLQLSPTHPLQFLTIFPGKRLDYYERPWEWAPDPRGGVHKNHTDGCDGEGRCKPKCRFGKAKQYKRQLSGPPRKQGSPPRPSYITFVGPRDPVVARPMIARFVEGAENPLMVPGALVLPAIKRRR